MPCVADDCKDDNAGEYALCPTHLGVLIDALKRDGAADARGPAAKIAWKIVRGAWSFVKWDHEKGWRPYERAERADAEELGLALREWEALMGEDEPSGPPELELCPKCRMWNFTEGECFGCHYRPEKPPMKGWCPWCKQVGHNYSGPPCPGPPSDIDLSIAQSWLANEGRVAEHKDRALAALIRDLRPPKDRIVLPDWAKDKAKVLFDGEQCTLVGIRALVEHSDGSRTTGGPLDKLAPLPEEGTDDAEK